ncbi:MAG TPA: type I-D CRISPR-associated protein Cas7/Csc2 [Anaerolineae bacterium]|nr:type I-D CRISPR-associated protein Cas7/Csc2 [Anaerolineae bacterium]
MKPLNSDWFLTKVPGKPMGRYAHIIMVRVTDSYPLFQTDGELNTARVNGGVANTELITRLTLFKRKQSTPERLVGRELLRRYGLLSSDAGETGGKKLVGDDGLPICDYNVQFCTTCPDCISYGFAIGDSGSEKSKVITDTAYSLTSYDHSHEAFTLNAPYEDGTMTRYGEVTSRINEQDHIQPQVIFPSVVTTRDLTENLFLYVLGNVLRARRYGAQTTRTGKLHNQVVAVALTDGEIFSNLLFTQRLYDALKAAGAINPPDPLDPELVFVQAQKLVPTLLHEDGVVVDQLLIGEALTTLLTELTALNSEDAGVMALLNAAFQDSRAYHQAWIAKASGKK